VPVTLIPIKSKQQRSDGETSADWPLLNTCYHLWLPPEKLMCRSLCFLTYIIHHTGPKPQYVRLSRWLFMNLRNCD